METDFISPDAYIPHEYSQDLDTVLRMPVQAIHSQILKPMEYGPYFLWRIYEEGFIISMN